MDSTDLITIDPAILGGTPVFKGTRVPLKTLFEYLENDYTLEQFLECFPSITREMARNVLTLLQRDHYLVQQPDGKYRFCFPLIQRSWILAHSSS